MDQKDRPRISQLRLEKDFRTLAGFELFRMVPELPGRHSRATIAGERICNSVLRAPSRMVARAIHEHGQPRKLAHVQLAVFLGIKTATISAPKAREKTRKELQYHFHTVSGEQASKCEPNCTAVQGRRGCKKVGRKPAWLRRPEVEEAWARLFDHLPRAFDIGKSQTAIAQGYSYKCPFRAPRSIWILTRTRWQNSWNCRARYCSECLEEGEAEWIIIANKTQSHS